MKINYSMKLISPANTASLGNIDKITDIGVKIDSKGNPIIFGKQIKGILKNTAISFRNALNLGDQKEFIKKIFWRRGGRSNRKNF